MSFPGGYVYYPSRYSPPLGHAGLDIELRDGPGRGPATIRSVTFPVATSLPHVRTLHNIHNLNGEPESIHVCPGCFRMVAGNEDVVHGISFGGIVHVAAKEDCTLCRLESPAPIFDMDSVLGGTRVFLYAEFLALLARRRAACTNDAAFARKLVAAEPFTLFVATLLALENHLSRFRGAWSEEFRRSLHCVRRAIFTLRMAGEWPVIEPDLAGLL